MPLRIKDLACHLRQSEINVKIAIPFGTKNTFCFTKQKKGEAQLHPLSIAIKLSVLKY